MAEEAAKKTPKVKLVSGAVSITGWENVIKVKDEDITVVNFTLERSYKNKDDEWQTTNSFREADLPRVIALAQKAYAETTIQNK